MFSSQTNLIQHFSSLLLLLIDVGRGDDAFTYGKKLHLTRVCCVVTCRGCGGAFDVVFRMFRLQVPAPSRTVHCSSSFHPGHHGHRM